MSRLFSPAQPLRVLLIEDSSGEALLIKKALALAMPEACVFRQAGSLKAALKCLAQSEFDVALLDRSLPDTTGFSGLISIQNMAPKLPVIFLTALKDEAVALSAVARGAQDYLFKDKADGHTIKRAIDYAIHRKQFEGVLIKQANFDGLTGLANRLLLESRLDMALAKMQRISGAVSVFIVDLNLFAAINDHLGHAAGDKLLRQVADRLKRPFREYDTVARFGGDDFAVLIEDTGQAQNCIAVAQKIIDLFTDQPFPIEHALVEVSVSIGITNCVSGGLVSRDQLMRQAEQAMRNAKADGRSGFRLYGGEMLAGEAVNISSADRR
jgi:diguanylate cyclase (GGDEF)-like protein